MSLYTGLDLSMFKREEWREKKLLDPYVWYSPNDAPLFVPATPGFVPQEVANEHMWRLGMKVKVIEIAGRKLRSSLVNLDLIGFW